MSREMDLGTFDCSVRAMAIEKQAWKLPAMERERLAERLLEGVKMYRESF